MTMQERTDDMLARYGECCNRAAAAKILGRSATWIRYALEDGRLDFACAGTMVDVRSIARYLCAPRDEDIKARKTKYLLKRGSEMAI